MKDTNQYLDQPDHHFKPPQMVELAPPKPPRQSPPTISKSSLFDDDDDDVDSLGNDLTLLDVLARQEKNRTRGSRMPNRDFDDVDSEMTSVAVDDIDDVVTVPVYQQAGGGVGIHGATGGGSYVSDSSGDSGINPFLEELKGRNSTEL